MKILVFTFLVCLSISNLSAQEKSGAASNKRARISTIVGASSGQILKEDEIAGFEESISKGYTCYIQNLYRHYECVGDSKKCSEWLKYGLEREDMWCMCYMYAFHKEEMSKSEAEKLKTIITKHKEEKNEYVFYTSEIFGIDWDE